MPRTFYRIAKANPPDLADFLPHGSMKVLPTGMTDPVKMRSWTATSVEATEEGARQTAQVIGVEKLGRYIVRLEIPDDLVTGGRLIIEQTGRHGHHGIWGDPRILFRSQVGIVVPV